MMIPKVATREWGGPDGRAIADLPGVTIDHGGDQFVDGAAGHPRASRPSRVEQASPQFQPVPALEPAHPVVDRLPADTKPLGDLSDVGPLGEPEECLGPTSLLGQPGVGGDEFQLATLPITEREKSHRFTLGKFW
jgi:hypothetical protein